MKTGKNMITLNGNDKDVLIRPKFGSTRIVNLPHKITPEICFLAGSIIGDGHLRKDKSSVEIELSSLEILGLIKKNFEKIFSIKLNLREVKDKRPNRKLRWRLAIYSKLINQLFNIVFEIPIGKKSFSVTIPKLILNSNLESKKHFLLGLFLTDGGLKRKKSISFTCSNKAFALGIKSLLNEFGINSWISQWLSKISKKFVFDVIIQRKDDLKKFINIFPLSLLKLQGYPSLVKGAGIYNC